ncbi:spore germination protein GerPE [Paenibacillus beijingensis]|uniref:spore germination protein GerPE n=1 Tax=Paenibacillus beijingensis TaxID=1126833 RepID=UPI0006987F10|nr:spore germination protein GerPE [Paenibacillus beijingensis]
MTAHDDNIRTAEIGSIDIILVSLSGVVLIGDTTDINAKLRALAVQRQMDHTAGGTVEFESFGLFSLPQPALRPIGERGVKVNTVNECPRICVGSIKTMSVGASSVLLAGNTVNFTGDARIKHFRQFSGPLPYSLTAYVPSSSTTDD